MCVDLNMKQNWAELSWADQSQRCLWKGDEDEDSISIDELLVRKGYEMWREDVITECWYKDILEERKTLSRKTHSVFHDLSYHTSSIS